MTHSPGVVQPVRSLGIVTSKFVWLAGVWAEVEAKTGKLASALDLMVLVLVSTMETLAVPV